MCSSPPTLQMMSEKRSLTYLELLPISRATGQCHTDLQGPAAVCSTGSVRESELHILYLRFRGNGEYMLFSFEISEFSHLNLIPPMILTVRIDSGVPPQPVF